MADSNLFRWVQRNYYSKTELTTGALDSRYFTESEHVNASGGAGDAGKPVKLNSSGVIDATMMSGGSVATHAALTAAHGATGAVVGTTNTQTLTNKTLTAPVIATIVNTGTLTLPTSTDTLVGRDTTDTLTNKTLTTPIVATLYGSASSGGNLTLQSTSHATKGKILFGTSAYDEVNNRLGVATNTPTVPFEVNGNAVISGTATVNGSAVVNTADTQTLSNKTLITPTISGVGFANATHTHQTGTSGGVLTHTGLSNIGTNTHADIDTHISATAAHGATGAVVGTTNTQTLTNKTLTAPVIATIVNTGTLTLPSSTDTLVGRATTDTLTNKTLTTPVIDQVNPSANQFTISGDILRITTAKTPSSSSDTSVQGQIFYNGSFLYVATGTNQIKRIALVAF